MALNINGFYGVIVFLLIGSTHPESILIKSEENILFYFPWSSAANNYYCSAGHHEWKNKKTIGQIKFLAVTIK